MADDPTANLTRSRSTWLLWAAAFVVAIAIHGGAIAAALMDMRAAAADDEVGAPAIEVGIELASPKAEQSDLPPGPESEASAASAAQVEQTAVTEQSTLPKDVPIESEDPDRVVATETAEKPKEEQPTPQAQSSTASQESVAAEATAPPVIENAPEAPKSVAPVQGTGSSTNRIVATWQRRLVAHLDRNKRYPGGASPSAQQVLVSFTIDRTGKVTNSVIAKSSGSPAFDAAALAMMKRADPLPSPPPMIADEGLTFTVPVVFRKQRG